MAILAFLVLLGLAVLTSPLWMPIILFVLGLGIVLGIPVLLAVIVFILARH